MSYKSKHTGAQVDEAVSKVLNGDVGGGATPDWNAKEGEAGYIENRPFERKNIEPFMYDNEVVYEDFGDIDIYIQCYDSIYSFPFGYNDDGLFIESEKEIYIPEDSVSIKVRRCEYEMRIQSLNSELDVNDIPSLITVFYVDRKLNQSDIDNTVLKTTPQELSDADKNQALANLGIQDKLDKLVNITYSELKSLRDNSKLIPGQQYRITDYITTTTQSNTQSAGHLFDVIVIADDVDVLNEEARACIHDGDTYFTENGANLSAWKIWYSLDNDNKRFAWADATNGKGVIYYMKDEFNNECPYDFKNIQFRHPNDTDTYPDYYYTFTWIDENYDIMDTSIFGNNGTLTCYGEIYGVYSNVIKPYMGIIYDEDSDEYLGTKQLLNSIIFISDYKYEGGNDGFFGCYRNSFGVDCDSNSFGNDCNDNSFGVDCYGNSFGNNCYRNSFGVDCDSNSFGNGYNDNSFGDNCYGNSFGNDCNDNSFGDDCSRNSFGNNCYRNSFGDNCYGNSFGDNCYGNSFGDDCSRNSFGESSSNPKSYYCYIIFDNGNSYINLNCTSTTSSSKYYQNVRIGLGVNNIDTDTYKTINDSNVGQTYETCYKPADSKDLTA